MAHLIDKDAVVAELEKRVGFNKSLNAYSRADECNAILSFIDTLEVKEVDLQKEIDRVWDNTSDAFLEDGWKEFEDIVKHFFELGLRASNPLTWEDIRNIDHILDGMRNENQVFGYPKFYEEALRRFKALKGE